MIGAVVLLAAAFVTEITDDTILVPNVIVVGSFLVPVCTVLFVLARPHETHLTVEILVLGFLTGGTAGVVLTAVTEVYVLPDHVATNAVIGLIEESGKIGILLLVASLVRTRVPRDGMALGATVGAGFAAFETSGYVLRALVEHSDDHPILNILETEAFRGVLAPFGHITWTAILGGADLRVGVVHRAASASTGGSPGPSLGSRDPARPVGLRLRMGHPGERVAGRRRASSSAGWPDNGRMGRCAHGERAHALSPSPTTGCSRSWASSARSGRSAAGAPTRSTGGSRSHPRSDPTEADAPGAIA